MKKKNNILDIVKSRRKQSREEEIELHGKQISFRTTITKSKKKYDRKKNTFKEDDI